MRKPITMAVTTLASWMLLLGSAEARQTPSAPAVPAQTPPAKPAPGGTAPAAKPGTATAKTAPSAAARKPATPLTLNTDKDKASYAIGMNIGKAMHRDSADVDPSILLRGLKDGIAGGKTLLTDDEARTAIMTFQTQTRQKLAENNKTAGETFFAANKAKPGVVVLSSGLQYKIIQEGTGPKPATTDTVLCNYKGALLDNTEFDSSYKRGQPAPLPVGGNMIKGWTEALQLMPVGSKWQIFIPSDLGYGAPGNPRAGIGPNATLVFEVELLSIQPKPQPGPAPNPAPGATPNPTSAPSANPAPATNPTPAPVPNPNPNPPPNPQPKPAPSPTPTPTPTASR